MSRFQPNEFVRCELDQLFEMVADLHKRSYRFVQICATTLEDSCEVLYAFIAPDAIDGALTGVIIEVPDGVAIPSITELYPAAFVFENETHDLFGIDIYGINLDFHGEFYKVSQKFPMNPRAAAGHTGADGEEQGNE